MGKGFFHCGVSLKVIKWIPGHFGAVSKYKYLFFFWGYFCFCKEEFSSYLLMKEGVVIVEIKKWLARFLEPVTEEDLWSSLLCFVFQLISMFVHVFYSSVSRACLTQFPDK